jgi:hypothetical protein
MAETLSLSSAVQVFPCPNCNETINTSMQQCTFCSAPIDPIAAQASAEATAKISRACSDASYLKIMAGCALGFFGLRFVPLLMQIGWLGFNFLAIAIPFMSIRWWVKYGRIKTSDPDFVQAKLSASYVTGGLVILFLFLLTGRIVIHNFGVEFNAN